MSSAFKDMLYNCSKNYIQDVNFFIGLEKSANAREALIKRALKKEELIHLKRGLYLIGKPYNKTIPNLYEMAQLFYSPSYISLESALSFHGWIPEAVYTTTCVSPKRAAEFKTPIGHFSFSHVPIANFYSGVQRMESPNGIFLMASGWKALADCVYVYRKEWKKMEDIMLDLRVEEEQLRSIDAAALEIMIKHYANRRVKNFLHNILQELG